MTVPLVTPPDQLPARTTFGKLAVEALAGANASLATLADPPDYGDLERPAVAAQLYAAAVVAVDCTQAVVCALLDGTHPEYSRTSLSRQIARALSDEIAPGLHSPVDLAGGTVCGRCLLQLRNVDELRSPCPGAPAGDHPRRPETST